MTRKTIKNQRRTPKQQRALSKYNAVLDACTQVLIRQGYDAATILELSLESEVAVPTIYQYFENKEAIFLCWFERLIEQVLAAVSQSKASGNNADLNALIYQLTFTALSAVAHFKPAIQPLLQEIPQTLSGRMLETIEDKTFQFLETQFASQFQRLQEIGDTEHFHFQVRTLIRLVTGYFIQRTLGTAAIDTMAESRELAQLIQLYLEQSGITTLN